MATRRTWFVWHSWIGVTAGLLMFVICWSGTVAVFARDIDRLLDSRIEAPARAGPIAWQAIHDSIRQVRPGWTINQINAPYAPGFAAEAWMEDEGGGMRRIYADPVTGEITGVTSYFNVQRFFRSLHMAFFIYDYPILGIPFGFFLVGVFSLVLLASLVTSLLFYRRFWRGFFKLQTRRGPRVFWSDAHKLVGVWSLWFVAIVSLTGFWYLIEWKTPESPAGPAAVARKGEPLSIDALVRAAQSAYPELRIRTVALHSMEDGIFEVQGQDGSLLVRDRGAKAWVNVFDGSSLGVQRPADLSLYQRWIDTADPLHFGDFGGPPTKAIWFLFGLGLSVSCLTGAYLQVKRQGRHHETGYRTSVLIAYLATLSVLLLSAYHGYSELLTYGSGGRLPEVSASQVAVIAAWLASTVLGLALWMRAVR